MKKSAFSLVELSIVLVILGLLVGGILAGQSLIRASELRAASTEHSRWVTATHAFRDKYFGLPGDITNATNIWGSFGTGTCPTGSGTGTQTCNGNGDNQLGSTNASEASDMFLYWQHLSNAGLIAGTYSGKAGSGGTQHAVPGTNVPYSKMSGLGWSVQTIGVLTNANFMDAGDYGHVLFLGAPATNNKTFSGTGALAPEEAWNIDTKMDDGKPGTGKVMTLKTTSPSWGTGCATSDTADATNSYALTTPTKVCPLIFRTAF